MFHAHQEEVCIEVHMQHSIISIMDAYHAPYSKRHRYWTGLMLLTRCVLFLAFAFNADNGLLVNMYITNMEFSS